MTIGLFTTDEGPWGSDDAGVMVVVGGAAVGLTGALVEASGHDRLSRAIWEYNRALRP